MENNKRTIVIVVATLVVGFGIGWLFKPSNHQTITSSDDQHTESSDHQIWTCSMHPQIQQSEPGKCPLCGMDLIPLETDTSGADPNAIQMTENAMRLANVQTMIVGEREANKELRLNGKVQVDERKLYAQSTHIPGRIELLNVNFTGESVSRGQTLAMVYSPELVTAQEELLQAYDIKSSQPELFDAAKQKLSNWKIGENTINKIISSKQIIQRFPIAADVSGIVTTKKVDLGDYVERGMPLYEIADLSSVWVLFDVYENDMPWVKVGNKVTYTMQSLPGETFEGTIAFIDPLINPQTRVATARVEVKNPGNKLKPEMFASGIITNNLSKTASKEIVVPKSAVMWTGERSVVYTKDDAGNKVSFKLREVTLGPSLGDAYVIKAGLENGEEIVVNGTFTVDAAAQLAGKPSMMNPEGGTTSTGHNHGDMQMTPAAALTKMKVSAEVKTELERTVDTYLQVKDGLVNDDFELAKKEAEKLKLSVSKIDMNKFKGDAHHQWMDYLDQLNKSIGAMQKAKDISAMRSAFQAVSNTVIALTETFGPFSKSLFVEHCPMADNNKGADWLSLSNEIKNPYFGEAMLKCGEVKREIKSN